MSASLKQYEIMFIVAGDKTDDIVRGTQKAVQEEITSRGGAVTKEDNWGLRDFSYPIKRQTTGYYSVLNFTIPSEKVNDFSKHLRLNTNVLRFMVMSLPDDYVFLTQVELREKNRKVDARRDADSISAEGKSLKARAPRSQAPRATAPATPAPVTKTAPVATLAPVPVAAPAPTPAPEQPAVVAKSDEERLKELDSKLGEILKEDEI